MRFLLIVALAAGCGRSSPQPGTQEVTDDPPAPAPEKPACDARQMRSCFGPIKTIAGAGKIGRKGQSGWRPAFEGADATSAELSRPHFAMADTAGNIYVADKDAHAVRRIDGAGKIHTVAGTGKPGDDGDEPAAASGRRLSSPNGLWARADGTLYILDLGNGKVRRVSKDGQMTTLFRVPGGISIGRGLWVSGDETRAFIGSNQRVLQWRRGGVVSTFASGFRSLGNLVVDPRGRLVVTDRSAGRVYRLDTSGNKELLARDLDGVRAVWFDDRGGMFLGTHQSSKVWYLGADGVMQPFLDESEVSEVRGLSVDARGNLIIVDDDRGFVRVVSRRPR